MSHWLGSGPVGFGGKSKISNSNCKAGVGSISPSMNFCFAVIQVHRQALIAIISLISRLPL